MFSSAVAEERQPLALVARPHELHGGVEMPEHEFPAHFEAVAVLRAALAVALPASPLPAVLDQPIQRVHSSNILPPWVASVIVGEHNLLAPPVPPPPLPSPLVDTAVQARKTPFPVEQTVLVVPFVGAEPPPFVLVAHGALEVVVQRVAPGFSPRPRALAPHELPFEPPAALLPHDANPVHVVRVPLSLVAVAADPHPGSAAVALPVGIGKVHAVAVAGLDSDVVALMKGSTERGTQKARGGVMVCNSARDSRTK